MSNPRVVVAGSDSGGVLERAAAAGLRIAGEAVTYADALALLAASGADAIVCDGIPGEVTDPAVATVVVLGPEDVSDHVALGAFSIVPAGAPPAFLTASVRTAMAWARALAQTRRELAGVREQLEGRKLIERAKGILMRRLGLSEDDAYRRLRRASQDENRKMSDVADSIIRTERIMDENTTGARSDRTRSAG